MTSRAMSHWCRHLLQSSRGEHSSDAVHAISEPQLTLCCAKPGAPGLPGRSVADLQAHASKHHDHIQVEGLMQEQLSFAAKTASHPQCWLACPPALCDEISWYVQQFILMIRNTVNCERMPLLGSVSAFPQQGLVCA